MFYGKMKEFKEVLDFLWVPVQFLYHLGCIIGEILETFSFFNPNKA